MFLPTTPIKGPDASLVTANVTISSVTPITSNPWYINFDSVTGIEDYIVTRDNGTPYATFYKKTGQANMNISVYDPNNSGYDIFFENKNYRLTVTGTTYGNLSNYQRCVTQVDWSSTTQDMGYTLTAPASDTEREMKIFCAVYSSSTSTHYEWDVTATLTDGSGATDTFPIESVISSPAGADKYMEITITYVAESTSTIEVRITHSPRAGVSGNGAVQAFAAYIKPTS